MKEELTINGRLFVSSSLGSELVDYTSDYIGQLARDGKITYEKIGRTLYVDQYELLQYAQEKNGAGEKRGPKKKIKSSKPVDTFITMPEEEEVRNSIPLSYKKDIFEPVVKHRNSSTKPVKNLFTKDTVSTTEAVSLETVASTEEGHVVGQETHIKTSDRKKEGRSIKSSYLKTFTYSILIISTLLSIVGAFTQVSISYEQNDVQINQTSTSFGFQTGTFFASLDYFRNN